MNSYDQSAMYPVSSYRTRMIPREPIREGYHSPVQRPRDEPPLNLWIGQFWKCVHIMARIYSPGEDKIVRDSFNCFFRSLIGILPSNSMRILLQDFITMTPRVQTALLENKSLSSFFTVHHEELEELSNRSGSFFEWSLEDGERLFAWTFLLHAYFNILNRVPIESFNVLKSLYHPSQISKETWANPLWYLIHLCAYHSRQDNHCNLCFKAFISCLRYNLPCPKCRQHLSENIIVLDIDDYLHRPEGMFEYSVDLHNVVNKSLGKPIITTDEARRIYDPYGQPLVRQNMSVARFINTRN